MVRKKDLIIKTKTKKIVQKYKRVLKSSGIKLDRIVLFGSQIDGKAHKDSDIDVCVVSPQFGRDWMKEEIKLKDLAMNVDIRIEPHPYSVKDFQVEEDPFAFEIKKTGVVIQLKQFPN